MSIKRTAIIGAIFALTVCSAAWGEGDPAAGRIKADTCLGCHGIVNYKNVYPTYRVPKLCGQHAQYILDALTAYTNGDRPHSTMHAQAASVSDADRVDIAAYFADPAVCGKGR